MSQKMDVREEHTTIVLKRLFDKKDTILHASHEMEDLRVQYRSKGCQDADGKIEAEVYKRIYTIISCLSELSSYAKHPGLFNILVTHLPELLVQDRAYCSKLEKGEGAGKGLHIVEYKSITLICLVANSIEIQVRGKKEPLVKIDNLESIINLLKVSPKLI